MNRPADVPAQLETDSADRQLPALGSATLSATVAAGVDILVGVVVFAVGVTGSHPQQFAVRFAVGLAIWCVGMGLLGLAYQRKRLARAVSVADARVETSGQLVGRTAGRECAFVLVMLLLAVAFHQLALVSFVAGNGVLFLVFALTWRGWERRH